MSAANAGPSAASLDDALRAILKSYDRIGFGRRGVLDAEPELCRFAAQLSADDHLRFRQIVISWLTKLEAERVTAQLHYNLPEHLQALAIHLCASVPIPESLPALRRLQAEHGATADASRLPWSALNESLARLR